jgi:hypothetical protein
MAQSNERKIINMAASSVKNINNGENNENEIINVAISVSIEVMWQYSA